MTARVQTKPGRPNYYIVLDYKDADGKRKIKWVTTDIPIKGNNKRVIEERRKEVLAEYENQDIEAKTEVDLRGDTLFTDYILQWLETQKTALADSTYQVYKYQIEDHIIPWFDPKKIKLKDMSPAILEKFIEDKVKDVTGNTVRKHLVNISKCLKGATSKGIIPYNPAKVIEWPKLVEYTGAQVYGESQILKLLDGVKGDPMELMILITIYYGLRRSELLGLKWNAIDFEQNTITIKHTVTRVIKEVNRKDQTKRRASFRTLPMSDNIVEQLRETKLRQDELKKIQTHDYKDEGYIFTHPDGSLVDVDYPTQHFKRLAKRIGLPVIRFHDLRHSAGTYLMYLGFSVKEIQEWLGQSDIQTTLKYLHFDMDGKRNMLNKINARLKTASK